MSSANIYYLLRCFSMYAVIRHVITVLLLLLSMLLSFTSSNSFITIKLEFFKISLQIKLFSINLMSPD